MIGNDEYVGRRTKETARGKKTIAELNKAIKWKEEALALVARVAAEEAAAKRKEDLKSAKAKLKAKALSRGTKKKKAPSENLGIPASIPTLVKHLMDKLNGNDTSCTAWLSPLREDFHLMVARTVVRNVSETINSNGFNPYERKTEEKLTKLYLVSISDLPPVKLPKPDYKTVQEDTKHWAEKGIIYIKSNDIKQIYKQIMGGN